MSQRGGDNKLNARFNAGGPQDGGTVASVSSLRTLSGKRLGPRPLRPRPLGKETLVWPRDGVQAQQASGRCCWQVEQPRTGQASSCPALPSCSGTGWPWPWGWGGDRTMNTQKHGDPIVDAVNRRAVEQGRSWHRVPGLVAELFTGAEVTSAHAEGGSPGAAGRREALWGRGF